MRLSLIARASIIFLAILVLYHDHENEIKYEHINNAEAFRPIIHTIFPNAGKNLQ